MASSLRRNTFIDLFFVDLQAAVVFARIVLSFIIFMSDV